MDREANQTKFFDRGRFLETLKSGASWDLIVIGGGATGLGVAVDAASRGYKTLLLEQSDFAKGTSSRSTKLVHGGVRYLAQGDVSLVFEALKERGYLLRNAPHVVKKQSFIIPCFDWQSEWKYLIGLKMYDWMAGRFRLGQSVYLSRQKVLEALPGLDARGLKGGVEYFDGQFDDARLAVNLAQTAAEQGGVLLNYFKVKGLLKDAAGMIGGVAAVDLETDTEYQLYSRSVVNATGIFVDDVLNLDVPARKPLVRPSQGVHLVLDKSFLTGSTALMIPRTSDGRVLFAVPWHEHILVGTTDTPVDESHAEPRALKEEIDFILRTAGKYLASVPGRKDVLSVFAGLRPLAATSKTNSTKEISRSHKLLVSRSGLVTITGGKWTTYRKMAEDVVDRVIRLAGLPEVSCRTTGLKIHGHEGSAPAESSLAIYGSDEDEIRLLIARHPELGERLHPRMPYLQAEVVWAVRNEMARTVEDVLSRRLRALFLDARAAIDMAPQVATIMARELQAGKDWEADQIAAFEGVAKHYLLEPYPVKSLISSGSQLLT